MAVFITDPWEREGARRVDRRYVYCGHISMDTGRRIGRKVNRRRFTFKERSGGYQN